jgi:acetate---CoA ligase (ADP-forming)
MAMGGAATDRAGGAADIALRDGTTVGVRPACPQDAAGLRRLFEGLSAESRYLRFFSAAVDVPLVVGWAADVDQRRRGGLVAVAGPQGRIVAHAGWERERDHPERAEVALVIDDDFQRRGLGTILLGQLAVSARGRGVELLVAEVLPGNHPMIQVFRDSGFDVRVRSLPGGAAGGDPDAVDPGWAGALRRAGGAGRRGGAPQGAGAPVGGGHRRVAAAWHGRG